MRFVRFKRPGLGVVFGGGQRKAKELKEVLTVTPAFSLRFPPQKLRKNKLEISKFCRLFYHRKVTAEQGGQGASCAVAFQPQKASKISLSLSLALTPPHIFKYAFSIFLYFLPPSFPPSIPRFNFTSFVRGDRLLIFKFTPLLLFLFAVKLRSDCI